MLHSSLLLSAPALALPQAYEPPFRTLNEPLQTDGAAEVVLTTRNSSEHIPGHGCAKLMHKGYSCEHEHQGTYLGMYMRVADCVPDALATMANATCQTIMFSPDNVEFGCRCCSESNASGRNADARWSLYDVSNCTSHGHTNHSGAMPIRSLVA